MAGFFFSLPRLILRLGGRDSPRSENNWTEANVAGALIHLVVYGFAFELLLAGRPGWQQLLFLLPLAVLVFLFWLALFYLNSLVIQLLGSVGLMRNLSDSRSQGVLLGIVITAFAIHLLQATSWPRLLGLIWLGALALNLVAAALLAVIHSDAAAQN